MSAPIETFTYEQLEFNLFVDDDAPNPYYEYACGLNGTYCVFTGTYESGADSRYIITVDEDFYNSLYKSDYWEENRQGIAYSEWSDNTLGEYFTVICSDPSDLDELEFLLDSYASWARGNVYAVECVGTGHDWDNALAGIYSNPYCLDMEDIYSACDDIIFNMSESDYSAAIEYAAEMAA